MSNLGMHKYLFSMKIVAIKKWNGSIIIVVVIIVMIVILMILIGRNLIKFLAPINSSVYMHSV